KQLQSDYTAFWNQRNSKFLDDLYFQSLCYLVLLQKGTNADEVARMDQASSVNGNILWLGGMMLLLERITPAQRQEVLSTYKWGGARKQYNPRFYDAQMAALDDWQHLVAVYHAYWNVWDDPDLMDKLKGTEEGVDPRSTNCFLKSVWLEADARFVAPEPAALFMGLCAVALAMRRQGRRDIRVPIATGRSPRPHGLEAHATKVGGTSVSR
ncbi:hypothetical protein GX586_01185, partial [bacterium]|nr:hypothetical protein [bacterium]